MAVLHPAQMAEEARQEVIAEAIIGKAPVIHGIEIVRGVSPLAMVALQRANNPYISGRKGFEAAGVVFVEKEIKGKVQMVPEDEAIFGAAMMPKTAEMLVVFSCTREQLKQFATNPAALEDAALELLDILTNEQLREAPKVIAEQLQKMAKSQATQDPDEEKPSAATLETVNGKKKHVRTG